MGYYLEWFYLGTWVYRHDEGGVAGGDKRNFTALTKSSHSR